MSINIGPGALSAASRSRFNESRSRMCTPSTPKERARALARSFGVDGVHIRERDSLKRDLEAALKAPGPMLIDIHVRRGENCYPMVPPGKSNAEMVGLPAPMPVLNAPTS